MNRKCQAGLSSLRILVLTLGVPFQLQQGDAQTDTPRESPETNEATVLIRVDAANGKGELHPIWRFFGYDEPNFTYMKDGRKLLSELSQLGPGTISIRTHHLLTSGDGAPALKWGSTGAYAEDPGGAAVYDWTIIDRIFDTYRERNLKPFVEIGFMPEALSTHPQDYPHNPPADKMVSPGLGFSYPPRDYSKWGELCFRWAKHCLERYGSAEVEQWRWEVWNEPNIFYWKATPEDYYKLYDFAVAGVRRAVPAARVGGPHTAGGPGGKFLHNFLEHCLRGTNYVTGQVGAPLDFIAFHAKGSPKFENGHVRMGIANQLQNIDAGFATVAGFPELRNKPIVIGECDPEGCAACQGPQLGYRNSTMYSSYTAASFARVYDLAEKHAVNLEGALTWAFEFENQPYFAGFRVLASNGIDLPVLNVFRMFSQMSGKRLALVSTADAGVDSLRTQGVRGAADVSALATLSEKKLCILVWNYHDDDLPAPAAAVALSVTGLPWPNGVMHTKHFRIDATHSNAYEFWKGLGSPQNPTAEQYAQLEKAGQLDLLETSDIRLEAGQAKWHLELPRQGVSLLVLEK
jgi:xylan 1,4-beta-xylosidase